MRTRAGLLLLLAGAAFAQDRGERFLEKERVGFEHLLNKEWPEAIQKFEEQIAIYAGNPRPYYNIACAHALQGHDIPALMWLEQSIDKGFHDAAHFDKDTDLDSLRKIPAFRKLRTRVEASQVRYSAIGPEALPVAEARDAESVAVILTEGYLARLQMHIDDRLQEESRIRTDLFAHYDMQMARLARYTAENGDARDAHLAGRERVRLASLYRVRANEGEPLHKRASKLVAQTADEFLTRWPGSPHRAEVQFWQAHAAPDAIAVPLLRSLATDAEGTPTGARAAAELALRDPSTRSEVYARFVRRYGKSDLGQQLIRTRLWRVRLEVEGIPDMEFEPPLGDLSKGTVVIAVVIAGQDASLEGIKEFKGTRLGLVVASGTWPDDKTPKARDPRAAVEALGVSQAPVFLRFVDGRLEQE